MKYTIEGYNPGHILGDYWYPIEFSSRFRLINFTSIKYIKDIQKIKCFRLSQLRRNISYNNNDMAYAHPVRIRSIYEIRDSI